MSEDLFENFDASIYEDSNIFDECISEGKKTIQEEEERFNKKTKYEPINTNDPIFNKWLSNRIDIAEKIILNSTDGNLHEARIRAANLLGGLTPHYLEIEAVEGILGSLVANKTDNYRKSWKDIQDGIRHGARNPIYFEVRNSITGENRREPCEPALNVSKTPIEEQKTTDLFTFTPDWVHEPKVDEPLIRFNGSKILSRGNISLFTALAGKGKSNICGAIWASAHDYFEADTLGFKCASRITVHFIDTEMSNRDSWVTWARALNRVGIYKDDPIPQNLKWTNIRGMNFEQRQYFFWKLFDKGTDLIILDGIGDLIRDVNEAEEVVLFVSRLCSEVHNNENGVFITLHENQAGLAAGKARGHLGSELYRKCESNLAIKDGDKEGVNKITTAFDYGKNRGGSCDLSVYYTWDNAKMMHATTNGSSVSKEQKDCEVLVSFLNVGVCYNYNQLKKIAMIELKTSESTAKRRISEAVALEYIYKSDDVYFKTELGSM